MRLHWLAVLGCALALAAPAKADSFYGFILGVSEQNTVLPGSMVSINGVLLNTGSTAISFAPSFPGGPPSTEGGSVPFAGISSGGQWSILANRFSFGDFLAQFAGVTVNPGESFAFTFGTFQAPSDQPLGSYSTAQLNFGIDFADGVTGNLLTDCHPVCNVANLPNPRFTLGNTASNSDMQYFSAQVDGQRPVNVPEPSSWEMLGLAVGAIGMIIVGRQRLKRMVAAPRQA
jgi:hypothetical protein